MPFFPDQPFATFWQGFPVIQVPDNLLERQVPVRRHKKRANQSAAYHRRIQKKWNKRWGTKTVRSAYLLNPGVLGLSPDAMVLAAGRREIAAMRMF